MNRYLLDSNQVVKFIENHPDVKRRVAEVGARNIAFPIMVVGELSFMAYNSSRQPENLAVIKRLLDDLPVIAPDTRTAMLFGDVKHRFLRTFGPKAAARRSKIQLESLGLRNTDLWIACLAIQHGFTLVSSDGHFARIQKAWHFDLETWWNPALDVPQSGE